MNWELIFKLAIGLLGLATAAVVAVNRVKIAKQRKLEDLAQANGLAANPTRCLKHEERMGDIESKAAGAAAQYEGLTRQIDGVASDVKTLIELHLKG